MIKNWSINSWRKFPILQQPEYPNQEHLSQELAKIKKLPPLLSREEIDDFKKDLREVQAGNRVIIHMGDCAERFQDCTKEIITRKQQFMDISAELVQSLTKKKVMKIGRIAGQYAKPRSQEYDDKLKMYNFKGDNINDLEEGEGRLPNPTKLYQGYVHSLATLNCLRQNYLNLIKDNQYAMKSATQIKNYIMSQIKSANQQELVAVEDEFEEQNALQQMSENLYSFLVRQSSQQDSDDISFKNASTNNNTISNNNYQQQQDEVQSQTSDSQSTYLNFYRGSENEIIKISHEAMLLDLEENVTVEEENKQIYNLSSHLLWVGYRTNQLDYAHLEYLRGIENTVGVKVGPQTTPDMMVQIAKKINPNNQVDKLIIIPRLGAKNIAQMLPPLIQAKQQHNLNFIWMLDAVHGNTETQGQFKVRKLDEITKEIVEFCKILQQYNEVVGGVSLESTFENVTECLGGQLNCVSCDDLHQNYKTACDPRLNALQTLEILQQFGRNTVLNSYQQNNNNSNSIRVKSTSIKYMENEDLQNNNIFVHSNNQQQQ